MMHLQRLAAMALIMSVGLVGSAVLAQDVHGSQDGQPPHAPGSFDGSAHHHGNHTDHHHPPHNVTGVPAL